MWVSRYNFPMVRLSGTGYFAWSGGNFVCGDRRTAPMAVADSINGIGLVIGGLMVRYLA